MQMHSENVSMEEELLEKEEILDDQLFYLKNPKVKFDEYRQLTTDNDNTSMEKYRSSDPQEENFKAEILSKDINRKFLNPELQEKLSNYQLKVP